MKTFPTGKETALLNLIIAQRLKKEVRDAVYSWSIADLGQAGYVFPNVHLQLDCPFPGKDPFTLTKAAENIAAEIGYFANHHAHGIKFIEVCLTNKIDGRSYEASLHREGLGEFPIPRDFNT